MYDRNKTVPFMWPLPSNEAKITLLLIFWFLKEYKNTQLLENFDKNTFIDGIEIQIW